MAKSKSVRIEGACHCGNIRFILQWPDVVVDLPVRQCTCSFCKKHSGLWTSNRNARLEATIADRSLVSMYRFGTATADFYVCSRCGTVPFVTSEVENAKFAVVNANTFVDFDTSQLRVSAVDFEGEVIASRLNRRQQNWIPHVQVN